MLYQQIITCMSWEHWGSLHLSCYFWQSYHQGLYGYIVQISSFVTTSSVRISFHWAWNDSLEVLDLLQDWIWLNTYLQYFYYLFRRRPTLTRRQKRILNENRDYVQKYVKGKKVSTVFITMNVWMCLVSYGRTPTSREVDVWIKVNFHKRLFAETFS